MAREVPCDSEDFLEEEEVKLVAERILKAEKEIEDNTAHVRGLIQANPPEQPENEEIEKYRKKIVEDYQDKVLRDEVFQDPPERGPYGYAKIILKEGAIPQRQRPFYMHGERKEAMEKIVEDWEAHKFIERPTGPVEWVCQGFAVPKKSATFPWRGVVDM